MGTLISMAIGAMGMLLLGLLVIENVNTISSIARNSVANCAVLEKPELRETEGIATYRVTFKDGKYQDITCISNNSKK